MGLNIYGLVCKDNKKDIAFFKDFENNDFDNSHYWQKKISLYFWISQTFCHHNYRDDINGKMVQLQILDIQNLKRELPYLITIEYGDKKRLEKERKWYEKKIMQFINDATEAINKGEYVYIGCEW